MIRLVRQKRNSNFAGVLNLTVMIMWHIWKSRNAWSSNNELTNPLHIMTKTLFEYNEYLDILLANSLNANISLFVDAGLQVESKNISIVLVWLLRVARVFWLMPMCNDSESHFWKFSKNYYFTPSDSCFESRMISLRSWFWNLVVKLWFLTVFRVLER